MAQVSVKALRDKASLMISEADTSDKQLQTWAEDKLAELAATWRAEVQPKLALVCLTLVNRLNDHGTAVEGRELDTLLKDAGLQHGGYRAGTLDQFFFPEWVNQTTPHTVVELEKVRDGDKSESRNKQLRGKGQALLALLEPITSDEVTTSWLDRSGFNGTWTGL